MAAVTAAVVVAAGSAYAANRQGAAAKDAGRAQRAGAQDAQRMYGEQYEQTREDISPWMLAGQNALTQQQALNSGDFSSFNASPDYQFTLDQGFKGLDRGAARGGNLWGGGADADRIALGQGLASQQYNNFYSKLASMSGAGLQAAGNLGNFGSQYAQNYGQQANNIGNANAQINSATAQAQAGYGNAIASGFGAYSQLGGMGGGQKSAYGSSSGSFFPANNPSSGWNPGWQSYSQPNGYYDGSTAFGQWGQGWGG